MSKLHISVRVVAVFLLLFLLSAASMTACSPDDGKVDDTTVTTKATETTTKEPMTTTQPGTTASPGTTMPGTTGMPGTTTNGTTDAQTTVPTLP